MSHAPAPTEGWITRCSDYRLGDLPRPFWVRFNKPVWNVEKADVDAKIESLVTAYDPARDCIALMTGILGTGAWWPIGLLLLGEAEWRSTPADRVESALSHWSRIGSRLIPHKGPGIGLPTWEQLQPDGTWKPVQ